MTEFNVLSQPRVMLWIYLLMGSLLFILGAIHFVFEVSKFIQISTFSAILNMTLGGIFLIQYFLFKRSDKYFVRINDAAIEWMLPGMKTAESVQLNDVLEVNDSWKEVELKTTDKRFTIPLKEFEWKESTSIRQAFRECSTELSRVNT